MKKLLFVLAGLGLAAWLAMSTYHSIAQSDPGASEAQATPASAAATPGGTVATPTKAEVAPASAGQQAAPGNVAVFTVQTATRPVTLTGFTRPRAYMTLVSEETGRCKAVQADVGDVIGPDGIFGRLDDTFMALDLEKNRAEQKKLAADIAFFRKEVERYQRLVAKDSAAVRDLEEDIRVLAGAELGLTALQVQEKSLQEHMTRFALRAPAGWKVLARHLEPGEWVKAGDPVAELGRFDVLLVPCALTMEELAALRAAGTDIALTLPDLGASAKAAIELVSPDFDPQTRKIHVDLQITSGDFEFRGGIRCELTLQLRDPGALLVPAQAVLKAYEEHFLVRPGGERVKITLLGDGPDGTLRVSSAAIKHGESFLLAPVS